MHTALLSGSPVIDVDATFLLYIVVFGLVALMLNALVFQPMMKLFDEREEAIDGAKKKAKKLEEKAEAKLESFEAEMARVRIEAGAERDRLRADGVRTEHELNDEVKAETDALLADASEEMDAAAKEARGTIELQSPIIAKQIAEKLLGREVSS